MSRPNPDLADATVALDALLAFRAAVIAGDNDVAWSLLFGPSGALGGFRRADVADRYLDAIGVSREQLSNLWPTQTRRAGRFGVVRTRRSFALLVGLRSRCRSTQLDPRSYTASGSVVDERQRRTG